MIFCRLLHHPCIYKYIHKVHHEWTAPISITAVYAHPIEHLMSNVFPVLMGPLVMGSHIATSWLWLSLAIANTLVSHCGYHLPLLPSPEAHDYHHQMYVYYYSCYRFGMYTDIFVEMFAVISKCETVWKIKVSYNYTL